VEAYRAARTRIAKTYQAEKALNETTGNIDAAAYAAMLKGKKPLTGGALQVAEFARQFPRLVQKVERIGSTGPTYFDLLAAGVSKEALLLGARPIARSILATRSVQRSITKPKTYERGSAGRAAEMLAGLQEAPSLALAEMTMGDSQRRKRRDELLSTLEGP
jgi:hypothetical protein